MSRKPTAGRVTQATPETTDPIHVAGALSRLPGFVYLDSVRAGSDRPASSGDRFSFLTARPTRVLKGNLFDEADFHELRTAYLEGLRSAESTPDFGFPTDGLYGWIGYDGDFTFGEYPHALVFDPVAESWTGQGDTRSLLADAEEFAESGSAPSLSFESNMSPEGFQERVRRAQDYISSGDIYQVNLSHRFEAAAPSSLDSFDLYRRLRDSSPAPWSACVSLGGVDVLSSSPEEFLSISGRTIRTRPIKGTRPRFRDREQDEKSAYDLLTSAKEVAELIMITDLERNDLGQICEFGSVEATELLKLERFAQVFHLVSTVEGALRKEVDAVSAMRACFPGGSITGAPKKRAREIIAELEPVPRGVYTGTIGCFGFNGESRFNIAIRTAVREGDRLHFHAGAGIVADSDPVKEWEETLHKASGLLQAFSG